MRLLKPEETGRVCSLGPNTLIILDDECDWTLTNYGEDTFDLEFCRPTRGRELVVLNQAALVFKLYQVLKNRFEGVQTLWVYPGRSAAAMADWNEWVWKYGIKSVYPPEFVFAERRFDSYGNAVAHVGEIQHGVVVNPAVERIHVIDDVVSSGITMRTLYKRNAAKFPRAFWYGCSLVSRLSDVRGYSSLQYVVHVPTVPQMPKAPINSLSTLLNDEKVSANYARKNFDNPDKFLESLRLIRERVTEDDTGVLVH